MAPRPRLPLILWLILAVACGLRLWGAWRANLTFDERAHVALLQTIDLRPGHLHLVARTVSHPLLGIYVMKLSSLVFGPSDLGLRMLHVLAGTATVLPVFFIGRRVFSERAGLWAAGLLAVDQFHVSWSRVALAEVWMLLFVALALLQFLRILGEEMGTGTSPEPRPRRFPHGSSEPVPISSPTRRFVVLGVLLGLGYLAKEPAVFLFPILWLYLLITPAHRRLLCRPQWYLSHAVFLLVIAPDLMANLSRATESYLYRDMFFLTSPFQVSWKPLSLYLAEVFRPVLGPAVLDVEYEQGHVYACYWPAGALYLAAVLTAVPRCREAGVRLLLVTFLVVFVAFIFIPGGGRFEPFWWASISLIPAVVCAGWVLDRLTDGSRLSTALGVLLMACLGAHVVAAIGEPGEYQARHTVGDFAADFHRRAKTALQRGDLVEAEDRYIFILNVAGPDAEAYYGLSLVAQKRGQVGKAEALRLKCMEVEPNYSRPSQR